MMLEEEERESVEGGGEVGGEREMACKRRVPRQRKENSIFKGRRLAPETSGEVGMLA